MLSLLFSPPFLMVETVFSDHWNVTLAQGPLWTLASVGCLTGHTLLGGELSEDLSIPLWPYNSNMSCSIYCGHPFHPFNSSWLRYALMSPQNRCNVHPPPGPAAIMTNIVRGELQRPRRPPVFCRCFLYTRSAWTIQAGNHWSTTRSTFHRLILVRPIFHHHHIDKPRSKGSDCYTGTP